MRRLLSFAPLLLLFVAPSAMAQTTIAGGNIINQTWTTAGSPYRINGDIIVPSGAYLHIEAGTVVEVATSDGLGSGVNTAEVEITVQGSLQVNGTSGSPVTIRGVGSGAGAWYGILVEAGASEALIRYATIEEATYGVYSSAAGTALVINDTTVQTCTTGVQLLAGSPSLQRLVVTGGSTGIRVDTGASATINDSIFTSNSSRGLYVLQNGATAADTTLQRSTVYGNGTGVYLTTSGTRQLRVLDSIVSNNSTGIYRSSASGTFEVSNTDVWGNSTNTSGSAVSGTGSLSANPLYVGPPGNLRITENSPCRFAGASMGDIGALPYTGDPTSGLLGTLWSNRTLSAAGSPYTVSGDLTVAPAVTLTVEPGVILRFATSDAMGAGSNVSEVELIVVGSVVAAGTAAQPITFEGAGSGAGAWYGILLYGSGTSTFDRVTIREATYGFWQIESATHTLQRSTIESCTTGVQVSLGTLTANTLTVTGGSTGIRIDTGAGATLSELILTSNSSRGLYVLQNGSTTADTTLSQSTVYGNGTGVYLTTSGTRQLRVLDSIVSNNSTGIYRSSASGTFEVSNTDVWGNSTNTSGSAVSGTGSLSANPLYVGPPGNLRITENSPCRFAGASMGDIGALPYTGDPTSGLLGTLWSNRTLSAAGSPYTVSGDLTVAPAVTLTVEPGVILRFATSDAMGAGSNVSEAELIVDGSVVAIGTASEPITFDGAGSGAGAWYGILLYGTSTSIFDHVAIREATYGFWQIESATHTLQRSTIESCTTGVQVSLGTLTSDMLTVTGGSTGIRIDTGAGAILSNLVLTSNSSRGLYVLQNGSTTADTLLHSSTVYGNGTGVYLTTSGTRQLRVLNSLVTNNSTGIYRSSASGTFEVSYCDVWGNSTNYSGSAVSGSGSISANPLYVGAPGDLRLTSTSTAVDAGNPAGAPDHDRNEVTRPLDGNGIGGAQYDMGAYEFVYMTMCGNGIMETGEACDSGSNNGSYGYCNSTCTALGPRCGDSLTNGPETCDDGNTSNTDGCLNTCVAASCGDSYVRAGVEQCDDGNTSNTDACLNTCANASCGDGYLRTGLEECDDGNMSNTDACVMGCVAARCGDTYVRTGVETCDDGNTVDGDSCPSTCVAGSCGDGIIDAGEECDDANSISTDGCVVCRTARCGDGFVRSGVEMCDDGNTVETDACLNSCVSARCGDGRVQSGVEGCDDGNANNNDACLNACSVASCGDGYVQTGVESCDDGNTSNADGCVGACQLASCGDGFVRVGVEMCDDGNASNADACAMCFDARCGDGYVQAGVEGCDDGNFIDTDSCPNTCMLPGCGDGVVQGSEACDDANASNDDACLVGCTAASCGDSYVWSGMEDCDDGNGSDVDSCLSDCSAAICGDGFVWADMEDCDDGNVVDGDGCAMDCTLEETLPDAGAPMGDGGTPVDDAGGTAMDAGTEDGGTTPVSRDGCGCRVPGGSSRGLPLAVWLVGLVGYVARRRRARG